MSHESENVPFYDQVIPLLGLYPGESLGHGNNQTGTRILLQHCLH